MQFYDLASLIDIFMFVVSYRHVYGITSQNFDIPIYYFCHMSIELVDGVFDEKDWYW
jgi:hypothetical protein